VFFLQDNSEIQEVLNKFLRRAQNEFDAKVNKIRSDNGNEFKNTQVEDFLDENASSMSFRSHIHLNKMGWQEPCLMNTRPHTSFGRRQSIRYVMSLTIFTSTSS
jgi:hypothetical protein